MGLQGEPIILVIIEVIAHSIYTGNLKFAAELMTEGRQCGYWYCQHCWKESTDYLSEERWENYGMVIITPMGFILLEDLYKQNQGEALQHFVDDTKKWLYRTMPNLSE